MSATPEPQQQPTEDKVQRTPLAEVIDQVRADAQRDPEAYARETVVPEGGE